ncbi:T-cell differentiation antigen CD6 [Bagarius yarrelli]|uniref:T-cell differentiation antigen CD6 n=1 Tax=Bagarius yarrelli TaxID=175774 RepID=A0A556TPR9_BAGYA|nr:T-cell differentiation antigen CD6 [Bagarius yarrelli]
MEFFKIFGVLQAVVLCQANLSINQASTVCSWTVSSDEEDQSSAIFAKQSLTPLANRICQALGCGKVHKLNQSAVDRNVSCVTDCSYRNTELIDCTRVYSENCSILSEVFCDAPYITPTNHPCIWNIRSPVTNSAVVLTQSILRLSDEICQNFNCGKAFIENIIKAPPKSMCLTDCTYHNSYLWNCSTVVGNDCSEMSEVICGNHKVRLSGGSHKCAGRVELWNAGQWGTVCDDGWDTQDADVVCAQLNCGYAISVNGQGGPYSQGRGPILIDELNCTGKERSLWECPAVREGHDCGHKEDAGVVCSEYKALRLTGGLDRCSGRVEIHRNGSWGTVCENCWEKQEASMACNMLGCGKEKQFTGFKTPFNHENGTVWFYQCLKSHKILWECRELDVTRGYMCKDTSAAGLICNTFQVQQRFSNLQTNAASEENNYRDSTHLVKITNNDSNSAPLSPPQIWTQSSVESASYDTDYEANNSGPNRDLTLSTFRNSMRYYNADGRAPVMNSPNLQFVIEEADSFETSSTSSGEHYENTGQKTADLYSENLQNDLQPGTFRENMDPSEGEDSPIYSPVSAEVKPFSHDSDDVGDSDDYDDVGNCLETPLQ